MRLLLKNRSIMFRARYSYGLKQIGSLRFRFDGMFAHAPCWRASSLIQPASYPRSRLAPTNDVTRRSEFPSAYGAITDIAGLAVGPAQSRMTLNRDRPCLYLGGKSFRLP